MWLAALRTKFTCMVQELLSDPWTVEDPWGSTWKDPAEEQAVEEAAAVEPSDEVADVGAEVPAAEENDTEQLTAKDLLPANDEADIWAETNPEGEGIVADKNFLTAGYHIGVDTVGQTLRNANYGLRSEPPNPREVVSPWKNTTIDADRNRRPLEIGGCN